MIGVLRRAYEALRGFDPPGTTVPVMDGPLRPNTRLDEAATLLTLPEVDNLVVAGDAILCSAGADLLTLRRRPDGQLEIVGRETQPAQISCLAASPDGGLAIGLDCRGFVLRGGRRDGTAVSGPGEDALNCPTAAVFLDADTLVVANGSAAQAAGDWKRDLMSKGASGSLWRLSLADPAAAPVPLARGLAFPSGLATDGPGAVFVSEAWRHRVLRLDARVASTTTIALDELPAYPGRIAPAAQGGFWLALFAPRNPLVEFVLGETLYCTRMMERVPPDYWIAPALMSGRSFLEPIQGGARKKLNQLKPWSPSWSYGLVARVNPRFAPIESLHSRADGKVHGVTSLAEQGGQILIGAKGAGRIMGSML